MSNKQGSDFRPAFIQIPVEVYTDKKLQPLDLKIYGFIFYFHSLRDGKCIASNATLARLADSTSRTVQNCLDRLEKNGHIGRTYKAKDKRHRLLIIPLYKTVRVRKDGRSTQEHVSPVDDRVSSPDDTRVRSGDDQSNSNSNDSEQSTTAGKPADASISLWQEINGKQVDLVAETIHRFGQTINPACSKMFNRKPQRQAALDLIEMHGWDMLERVIAILPKTNRIAYLPTITTPVHLWHKWADLEAGMSKMGQKKQSETKQVHGLDDIAT